MNWRTALRLGRVSNLPTVWSNTLAGATLAAPGYGIASVVTLMAGFSLFYVGGMYLNDAFDREIDARERPDRPIPAGQVSPQAVFATGFGLLAAGALTVAAVGARSGHILAALAGSAALAAAIVYYDINHKQNPFSPLVMGLCRSLIYIGAALALTGHIDGRAAFAAALLLAYVAGLTYVARQEATGAPPALWPFVLVLSPFALPFAIGSVSAGALACLALFAVSVSYALVIMRRGGAPSIQRSVALLIAAVSLLDATVIASQGALLSSAVAIGAFGLALGLQRYVPGT